MTAHLASEAAANRLVYNYLLHSHVIAPPRNPLINDDFSFGGYGFHFNPIRGFLTVRAYWGRIITVDDPKLKAIMDQSDAGLEDPSIGGLYDKAGGVLFHDHKVGSEFIVKNYSVAGLSQSQFDQDVDHLRLVANAWLTSWAGHIFLQAQGKESKPTQRITLENNPYKD